MSRDSISLEFTTPGDQGEQGRMDLLTAIAHEVGHLLGCDHSDEGVMDDTPDSGVRAACGGWIVAETRFDFAHQWNDFRFGSAGRLGAQLPADQRGP